MGDRGNIVFLQHETAGEPPKCLYFYSHWTGTELPLVLQRALRRGKSRWDDEPYLARIIFCEMVKGNETELIGFGISTYLTDNEYPLLVVDSDRQEVSVAQRGMPLAPEKTMSFADYCALSEKAVLRFRKSESESKDEDEDEDE